MFNYVNNYAATLLGCRWWDKGSLEWRHHQCSLQKALCSNREGGEGNKCSAFKLCSTKIVSSSLLKFWVKLRKDRLVGVVLCCFVQGKIEGAFSGVQQSPWQLRLPSGRRREGGSCEGYYALETGSADDSLLLLKPATKQCEGGKEEGRRGNNFLREKQYLAFLVTSLAAPLPTDRALTWASAVV